MMEIVQFVLICLILIGIFYVAFVQDRVTKIKDKLFDTFKDFPDIAEKRFKWKEENIRKEAEDDIKKAISLAIDETISTGMKASKDFVNNLYRIIAILLLEIGYDSKLYEFAEQLENEEVKKIIRVMINEVKKGKALKQ